MLEIFPLDNPVQHYDWGSTTAIPHFLGRPVSGKPVAEVWLGAHPKAPSRVKIGDAWTHLSDALLQSPEAWLGAGGHADEWKFPFLLKILAAAKPLSIQAHPNIRQAREGFDREEAAGVDRWSPHRNYRDRNHKPEIIYALEPFTLLCGFRPAAEILTLLDAFGLGAWDIAKPTLGERGDAGIGDFFASLMDLDTEPLADALATALAGAARAHRDHGMEAYWIQKMAESFPADRGVLAPLFLNIMHLRPGQAVFTGPGILHAYLDGLGIELMANSDNVLRGACTSKHVDTAELLRILVPTPHRPLLLKPESDGGNLQTFVSPGRDLRLTRIAIDPSRPHSRPVESRHRAQILLCAQGEGRIETPHSKAPLSFTRDTSFVVPASVGHYSIRGEGVFFVADMAR